MMRRVPHSVCRERHARLRRVRAVRTLAGFVILSAAACRRDGAGVGATGGSTGATGGVGLTGDAGGMAGAIGMDAGGGGGAIGMDAGGGGGGAGGGSKMDGGSKRDGGSKMDGGSKRDGGSKTDAGSNADAALKADAGDALVDAGPQMTLKAAASSNHRLIGAAVGAAHLTEAAYAATAAAEFDFVTPENEMKWDAIEPVNGGFDFSGADTIVHFAEQNGMQIKGHTLVWHSQLPAWVSNITDATALHDAMINHITYVVSHYRGQIMAWDVVNEAVDDSGLMLRDTIFYQMLGAGYIDDAFTAAHAADPGALLIYNDYGAEGSSAKSDYVYNLVKGMLARGVPINGVGLQMHTGPADSPSATSVAANMQRLALLGLNVFVSEMDVQICTSDLDSQSKRFHDIVVDCAQAPLCLGVTVWGVTDKYSWLNGRNCAAPRPLLFDDNYVPKPAHAGVINAFLGL